jgi:hypothetical protein
MHSGTNRVSATVGSLQFLMPYDMHRVFLATPFELDDERSAMHDAISEFNQEQAMARNVLFVTVSLPPNMADKRAYQPVLLENIRAARYYVQLIEDSWGPPQRNFERDFVHVKQYVAEGTHKTRELTLWFKKPLLPHRVEADIVAFKQNLQEAGGLVEFSSTAEVKGLLREKLGQWLKELAGDKP